jgi:cytochrome b561
MFMKNEYTYRVQIMHALLACLVLSVLTVGTLLNAIPEAFQGTTYMLHKSFGICIFFLMLIRLYFVHQDGRIKLPAHTAIWEKILARGVQYSLYLVLILMPLSGWLMSCASGHIPSFFGLFDIPCPGLGKNPELGGFMSDTHYYLAWIIGGLLSLHILGSLKHYFWDKDNVLQSMWSFKRKK